MTNWILTHWSFIVKRLTTFSFVPTLQQSHQELESSIPIHCLFPYTQTLERYPPANGADRKREIQTLIKKAVRMAAQLSMACTHASSLSHLHLPFTKSPLELAAPPRIMLQSQTVLIKAQVISLIKQQGHYQDFKSDTSTKVDFNKSRDCIGIMEKCVHQETLWGKIAGQH